MTNLRSMNMLTCPIEGHYEAYCSVFADMACGGHWTLSAWCAILRNAPTPISTMGGCSTNLRSMGEVSDYDNFLVIALLN
jgi:hypothetical protein